VRSASPVGLTPRAGECRIERRKDGSPETSCSGVPKITPRDIAKHLAAAADELKAANVVILDVRKLSDITDFFVICTGNNRRHLRAVQKKLHGRYAELGAPKPRIEGGQDTCWALLDFIDVVVHIFDPEARDFYDLELLWGDAPKVAWQSKTPER